LRSPDSVFGQDLPILRHRDVAANPLGVFRANPTTVDPRAIAPAPSTDRQFPRDIGDFSLSLRAVHTRPVFFDEEVFEEGSGYDRAMPKGVAPPPAL
jgi:hypothetical protein